MNNKTTCEFALAPSLVLLSSLSPNLADTSTTIDAHEMERHLDRSWKTRLGYSVILQLSKMRIRTRLTDGSGTPDKTAHDCRSEPDAEPSQPEHPHRPLLGFRVWSRSAVHNVLRVSSLRRKQAREDRVRQRRPVPVPVRLDGIAVDLREDRRDRESLLSRRGRHGRRERGDVGRRRGRASFRLKVGGLESCLDNVKAVRADDPS